MTVAEFTKRLEEKSGCPMPESIRLALTNYPAKRPMERRHAAKLIHLYLRDVCMVPDETDISGANELMDLYDCHTCAADIAQVYLKGIMPAKRPHEFGTLDRAEADEIEEILKRIP